MKKLFYILPLACLIFACKKESTATVEETKPLTGKSNVVFFIDTFRVYTTDLTGNNKKMIIDEDIKSGNNYITGIDYSANKKIIYGYKIDYITKQEIKTANADGSDKKTVKTFSNSNISLGFIGSFAGKILYATLDNSTPGLIASEIRMMDETGANDTKVNWPKPSIVARDGSGYLSISSDFGTTVPSHTLYKTNIENGAYAEAKSFNIPKITGVLRGTALSADGNTFIYLLAPSFSSDKYDVMSLDVSKKDGATKKIMTYEVPKTGDGAVSFPPGIKVTFANGTTNVILSYGVQVSTSRYATKDDYYFFQMVDVEKAIISSKWKISNEYGGSHIVD